MLTLSTHSNTYTQNNHRLSQLCPFLSHTGEGFVVIWTSSFFNIHWGRRPRGNDDGVRNSKNGYWNMSSKPVYLGCLLILWTLATVQVSFSIFFIFFLFQTKLLLFLPFKWKHWNGIGGWKITQVKWWIFSRHFEYKKIWINFERNHLHFFVFTWYSIKRHL